MTWKITFKHLPTGLSWTDNNCTEGEAGLFREYYQECTKENTCVSINLEGTIINANILKDCIMIAEESN